MSNPPGGGLAGAAAPHPAWARSVVIAAAIVELLSGVFDIAVLVEHGLEVSRAGLAGLLVTAEIALRPTLATAAVAFALTGRLTAGIAALAGIVLATWLSYLPSVAHEFAEFPGTGLAGLTIFAQAAAYPLLALAAVVLSLHGAWPGLAAILVAVPTLLSVLAVVAFGIGVGIFGF
jgi:hypothetical protein